MLSALFFEKALYGFFALVISLIAVIYKLFNGSLQKDLTIQKQSIKKELETEFETKFNGEVETLKVEVGKLRDEIKSFKNHENVNAIIQIKLLKKVLFKLDKHDPDIFNEAINED